MPPLSYLNSGPEDVYALNRLGSTFSDMVIGLQLNRTRQQQIMAQQALEQARLQLEREKEKSGELTAVRTRERIGAETEETKARTGLYGAQTKKYETDVSDTRSQMQAGGILGDVMKGLGETDASKNPDIANMLRAIAMQQSARIAATNPSNIGRQSAEIMELNDPIVRKLIATQSPAYMNVAQGGNLVDLSAQGGPRSIFSSPPRLSLANDPDLLNARILHELASGAGALRRGNLGQDTPLSSAMSDQAMQRLMPKPGEIRKGYRFKGGDPSVQGNWEPAQ